MSTADLPCMPFWVKDWIAATMHWPCAERGAYISLLAFQWINGHVPRDVPQLARISGCAEEEFERIWLAIGAKFEEGDDGLFNPRAEEHREEALRRRDALIQGASIANKKRREKKAARLAASDVPRVEPQDAERTHPYPESKSEEEKKKNTERGRSAHARRVLRGTYDLTADEDWLSFKLAFPMRAGGQPWRAAMKCWRQRIAEGHEPSEFIEGAARYAAFIKARGDERTTYVMHAKTFLGPEKYFLQDWELPTEAANDAQWSPPSDELTGSA